MVQVFLPQCSDGRNCRGPAADSESFSAPIPLTYGSLPWPGPPAAGGPFILLTDSEAAQAPLTGTVTSESRSGWRPGHWPGKFPSVLRCSPFSYPLSVFAILKHT